LAGPAQKINPTDRRGKVICRLGLIIQVHSGDSISLNANACNRFNESALPM
jgi:hypothetical protein